MDSFLSRFKNALVLVGLLLAQTIGLAIQVRRPVETGAPDGDKLTLARFWVVGAVTPVEHVFFATTHGIRSTWSNYVDLRHVRQHDRDLQYQIDQLRLQQASIAEDAVQGHRLQAMLAFQQKYISATVAAQVIGTSGTDISRVLYIDKGTDDGLKPDQAVITPDGVVGKLRDVFPHTSQVLLINDQTSGAGVILANTRIRAILRGTTGGRLEIGNLTEDSRIQPGEPVLTSGGDQIFPRGLPVGTVESIRPDPENQPYTAIRVRPTANLFQLEEVLVITDTAPKLPDGTLELLAEGARSSAVARAAAEKAAAEAAAARAAAAVQDAQGARSAAEIVADRLPSLHDPNAPEAKQKDANTPPKPVDPKTAGGIVPRPAAVLRPDRYSPGSTPPASALTPGGTDTSIARPAPDPPPHRTSKPPKTSRPITPADPVPDPAQPQP